MRRFRATDRERIGRGGNAVGHPSPTGQIVTAAIRRTDPPRPRPTRLTVSRRRRQVSLAVGGAGLSAERPRGPVGMFAMFAMLRLTASVSRDRGEVCLRAR